MAWKPEKRKAFAICVGAALVAVAVSLVTWESWVSVVGLPFGAFCAVDAALLAIDRPWTEAMFVTVPAVLVACGLGLFFGLGLGQVPETVAAGVALCWVLVLWSLTRFAGRAGPPKHARAADSLRAFGSSPGDDAPGVRRPQGVG